MTDQVKAEKLKVLDKQSEQEIRAVKHAQAHSFETLNKAIALKKDGFSIEQIAHELSYTPEQIKFLLAEKVEPGSPEQILQECLSTVLTLIPLAEAQYRVAPTLSYAQALTSFIDSARGIIEERYALKEGEETYKKLLTEILQPMCRDYIKDFVTEVGNLYRADLGEPGSVKRNDELSKLSRSLGVKYKEAYRLYNEKLAESLGLSQDAISRVLAGTQPLENK